ncbi:MAG: hypothetical protein KKF96_04180 [Proteobacteria bacterium]|nr:hypothetical protein [Pseudomonadota bacterium]
MKAVKTALVVKAKIALTALNAARETAFYLKVIRLKQAIHIYTGSVSSNTI